MNKWLQRSDPIQEIRAQKGIDLGERMCNAFREVFNEGFKKCILTGCDLPDLPREYINDGISALEHSNVTLGPTTDGGYYLIGFQKEFYDEEVFTGIEWGTNNVYDNTLKKLEEKELTISTLKEWYDIDRYEDLLSLKKRRDAGISSKEGIETKRKLEELSKHIKLEKGKNI